MLRRKSIYIGMFVAGVCAIANHQAMAQQWCVGTWDSTIYNRSEHPKTVGIRVEVRDNDSLMPIAGVEVVLKGRYTEQRIGTSGEFGQPDSPQDREFELKARTDKDGIAVLALGWRKEYPWDIGKPNQKDSSGNEVFGGVHTSWIKPVDDIEKVKSLEIRHTSYKGREISLNFRNLTEVGQMPDRATQAPEVFDTFRNAWRKEIQQEGVIFCVLKLGSSFRDYQNTQCLRPEFFDAIRRKQYGIQYREAPNVFSFGGTPQSECGPYMIYTIEANLERAFVEVRQESQAKEKQRESTPPLRTVPLRVTPPENAKSP